ncbi:hypothetical protein D9M73_72040 [compost metagenome]|jgi:hypothetical protein
MGFTVTLAGHHCHGVGRFPETLICSDCNSADGAAKRKLGLPTDWSFTPTKSARLLGFHRTAGRHRSTMKQQDGSMTLLITLAPKHVGSELAPFSQPCPPSSPTE